VRTGSCSSEQGPPVVLRDGLCVPPPAPVWRGLGARGHAAARGNCELPRARRSGAC
jgi:hypothetical protein